MSNYLIIGGSSGIGKELTKELESNGNYVYSTYLSHSTANTDLVRYQQLDVLDESQKLSDLPESLDGLAYCPGSINLAPFSRIKAQSFRDDYELQVLGAIRVIQQVLPLLKKSNNASVVLFSTVAVQQGFNFHSQVAASKGAIEGLTRALSAELAPTVRVNAIAPSITDTPLASKLLNTEDKKASNAQRHPLKRIGSAQDIAKMAAFLLSKDSSWTTGQVIPVDGGMSSIKL